MKLSQRMQNVVESQTIAMTKKARELKSKGHDVISLSIGEPDFDTPEVICNSANRAMGNGETHYPPGDGPNWCCFSPSSKHDEHH